MSSIRGGARERALAYFEKRATSLPMEQGEAGEMEEQQGVDCSSMLCDLLGMLLAMRQNYHSSHWQVSGPTFAADHELFSRLYGSVGDEIDTLGEKIVAMCGPDKVDALHVCQLQCQHLSGWAGQSDAFQRGLATERALQDMLRQVYDALKESGQLSLGMDDFLMAAANAHETNVYLLQQRVVGGATPIASLTRR